MQNKNFLVLGFVFLGFLTLVGFAIFVYADNIKDKMTQKSTYTGKTINEMAKLDLQCHNDETIVYYKVSNFSKCFSYIVSLQASIISVVAQTIVSTQNGANTPQ